jgi:Fe-S-cluster containining protein
LDRSELPFIRLDQIARKLDGETTRWFKQAKATGRPEDRPACYNGCAACCHQLVPLTTVEAQRIAQHVATLPRSTRRELVKGVDRQLQRFGAWVKNRPEGDIQNPRVNRDYLAQRIPCAFLGPQNECRIYPVRPIICRGHHALDTNIPCQNADQPIRTIPGLDLATREAVQEVRDLTASLGPATQGGLMTTYASLFRAALTGQLPNKE